VHRVALVTAVVATALTGLTALPAQASTPVERALVVVDPGTGAYELHNRTAPNGSIGSSLTAPDTDVDEVATSADGSRVATIESVYDAQDNPSYQRVVVRDVSGRLVRTLDTYPYDGNPSNGFSAVALSPDGTQAVWTRSPDYALRTAFVGAGAPSTVLGGSLANTAFVDDTTLLGFQYGLGWHTVLVGGGTTVPATGIPDLLYAFAVSPDHTHVAWTQESSPGAGTYRLYSATLTVTPGSGPSSVAVTAPLLLAQGFPDTPAFSQDGTWVYYVDGETSGALRRVPTNGGAGSTAVDASSIGDVVDVALGATDDGTAPGTATPLPAAVSATAATVHWALPADTDLSGVIVYRQLGGTTQRSAYVPAPLTSWTDSGLSTGTTYTYLFRAVDRSNRLSAATSRVVVPTAARPVTFTDPTSTGSAKASFVVSMPAQAPTGTAFTVDVRTPGGSWTPWVISSTARSQVFGSPAHPGVLASTSSPGSSYAFRVSYGVSNGNTTAWTASTWAVVPFDQGAATLSGGVPYNASYAYLGSTRRLTRPADYARITFIGSRFQVIGTRCASCGAFRLYDGGSYLGTFDSWAPTTTGRAVLCTFALGGEHTFTLRPVGTAGHPDVFVDAFAVRA